jgi:hypothetical protein
MKASRCLRVALVALACVGVGAARGAIGGIAIGFGIGGNYFPNATYHGLRGYDVGTLFGKWAGGGCGACVGLIIASALFSGAPRKRHP